VNLQNRVLPTGEIVAVPERGTFMGNRGILHDDARRLGTSRWTHPHWIICVLAFKGRHREVMKPGNYTELFFLDEAVALAAGHRPCAECRRDAWRAFRAAFEAANGPVARAHDLDRKLHKARVRSRDRTQITYEANASTLPDGCFIAQTGAAWLVQGTAIHRYTPGGYTAVRDRPSGWVTVLTPAPTVATLTAGYRPALHPTSASPA